MNERKREQKRGDEIRSVDFFSMYLPCAQGKRQALNGAVVFNEESEIITILAPCPSPSQLHKQLAFLHERPLKARLKFLKFSKKEVLDLINSFCNEGEPLPNIHDSRIAKISGITDFQKSCYAFTSTIPHGETRSYQWLTQKMRKSGAERAVGGALRSNPFPLFIPCHRVVKKDGKLGGFMGVSNPESWQLQLKRLLLDLEDQHRQPSLFLPQQISTPVKLLNELVTTYAHHPSA